MIYKLDRKDYDKIKPLLQVKSQHNLSTLYGVMNGRNRGSIYVDNETHPTTALVDETGIISLFIGDAKNQKFLQTLPHFIENELKQATYEECGGTYFLAVVNDCAWEEALEQAISYREYETDFEQYYRFNEGIFNSVKESYKPLLNGYYVQKVDGILIEQQEDVAEMIEECWYTVEDFLTYGLGYCIMKADRVISICISCCVHENIHEISVATYDLAEMNKGLATLVCAAYLEQCIVQGVIPRWSTLATNGESIHLAEKLGFEFVNKLKTYEFEF
ncbi:GNAT family N-acetyltransferase [Priestia taiwanensis]|uniref:Acetyltransferase n=1 Tax=Priestia taiwanensis TaxID=1347902 RepID=A0A917AJS0_9BACI|nr:GNAT family N-acetyltransferase [Priestia taiwanensis]MBM7361799.1 RimJ/RimL family protein N-acetyltransferase [Priestia taiwanensis]GGE57081.1 acetyltransferase [Priestia taiwanensis]